MGHAIAREERIKASQFQRAENMLALWDVISKADGFPARFKELGDYKAANLRGTYKGFPDSMLCASLTSDLEWLIQKSKTHSKKS
jgi:hypothetical protein